MTLAVFGSVVLGGTAYGLLAVAMARRCRTASNRLARVDHERSPGWMPEGRPLTAGTAGGAIRPESPGQAVARLSSRS